MDTSDLPQNLFLESSYMWWLQIKKGQHCAVVCLSLLIPSNYYFQQKEKNKRASPLVYLMVLKNSLENSTALFCAHTTKMRRLLQLSLFFFFFFSLGCWICAQGESTHTWSRQEKAAVSAAKCAWHWQVLLSAVLFHVSFLYIEKKASNTMIPRDAPVDLSAHCIYRLHTGMTKITCD